MNGCRADALFAIKSLVKEIPYLLLGSVFMLSALLGGYLMMLFERPMSDISNQNFNSYFNGLWVVVVTMTTVGYGDIYPKTFGGRVVGMTICVWGMFCTSFFTVTLSNFLFFDPAQSKSYLLLQRLYYKEKLREEAAQAVSILYKHKILQKK